MVSQTRINCSQKDESLNKISRVYSQRHQISHPSRLAPLKLFVLLVVALTVLTPVESMNDFLHLNSRRQVLAYYEEHSFYPILHVFYNRHFSKSKQFRAFKEDILEEVQFQMRDFVRIVFTDCEKEEFHNQNPREDNFLVACKEIKRLNENRMIVGYEPNNGFVRFGDMIMQNPSASRVYDHPSDIYTVDEVATFVNKMMPNFFKPIENSEQFHEFLNSARYVPKLLYLTNQEFEEFPLWTSHVSVAFFERFQIAYADDLTDSVIREIKHIISKQNMRHESIEISLHIPDLLVLNYDYELKEYRVSSFRAQAKNEPREWKYDQLQEFLEEHALKSRRNDHVFHMIKMPKESQIKVVYSQAELQKALDESSGWVIIAESTRNKPSPKIPEELLQKQREFGQYKQYIYYQKINSEQQVDNDVQYEEDIAEQDGGDVFLYLYNPKDQIKHRMGNAFEYTTLNADDFQSNITFWLKRDSVVMGVREKYGHICSLTEKHLFKGLTQCFVMREDTYAEIIKKLGVKNAEYGFINLFDRESGRVIGNQIKNPAFQEAYYSLEYVTRVKVKDLVDDFMDKPIKTLNERALLQNYCSEPKKLCIFYFYRPQKIARDNSAKEYLEMEAKNFMNDYKFFEVDLSCNEHILEVIPQLEGKTSGSMVVYHPRRNQYVFLKAKMTRNIIEKFLKVNIRGEHITNQGDHVIKKDLPFKNFQTKNPNQVRLNACGQGTNEPQQEEKRQTGNDSQSQSLKAEQL